MLKCSKCANAIFNPWWGEYKCEISTTIVYDDNEVETCLEFKEGEPKETLNNLHDDAK